MVFEIKSKKYGMKRVFIDDEDWPRVKEYTWSIKRAKPSTALIIVAQKHLGMNRTRRLRLDQFVLKIEKMSWQNAFIIHKDENDMNCRKENLRFFGKKEGVVYEI